MCDGDGLRRTVAVLAQNQVRLTAAWVVTLERIGAMQKYDHIRVLFEAVMQANQIHDEIVCLAYGSVVDILFTDTADLHDLVPEHFARCERVEITVVEHLCNTVQPRPTWRKTSCRDRE